MGQLIARVSRAVRPQAAKEAKSCYANGSNSVRKILEPSVWAAEQVGTCDLGDRRRTRNLVSLATQVANNPSGSTPQQTQTWGRCKSTYRLMNEEDVTFKAITAPHNRQTIDKASGVCLLLNDTTEVDFGYDSTVSGLSHVGNGSCGFLLHSSLSVSEDGEVNGLAGQLIRYRKRSPKNETRTQRLKRDRESLMWGQLIEQIGLPPEGAQFIDVCDRGADDFEVFCKMLLNRHDWVVRAKQLHRRLADEADGNPVHLSEKLASASFLGSYELTYRSKVHGTRVARMEVRSCTISMPAPKLESPWLKKTGISLITMHVVEAREVNPPRGVEPLHWVLLTSLPVVSLDDAWRVIGYYEKRWLIEEFHKALKTGCRLEERQYRTSHALEAVTGLLSITAVRLLQLRFEAKRAPDQLAGNLIPSIWITALQALRPNAKIETVGQFYRQVAGLGGHLLRKSDGDPGWIVIWRGFFSLNIAIQTIRQYNKKCG
jgi:hypothetical protein